MMYAAGALHGFKNICRGLKATFVNLITGRQEKTFLCRFAGFYLG